MAPNHPIAKSFESVHNCQDKTVFLQTSPFTQTSHTHTHTHTHTYTHTVFQGLKGDEVELVYMCKFRSLG